jgi:hypothetical protein
MIRRLLPNASLIALISSCFIQVGAQLFAILVIVRTVIAAPPRSFSIFAGEYGYDSGFFWETVPPITMVLFVVALLANWKTTRRGLLLLAVGLFLAGGVIAGVFLEPVFAEFLSIGYSDVVDPALQARAATWYAYDVAVWLLGLAAGITLLLALARPVASRPA